MGSFTFGTFIYLLITIVALGAALYVSQSKMIQLDKNLSVRADEYKNNCEVNGTNRTCVLTDAKCAELGGSSLGHSWTDCDATYSICCLI